MKNSIIITIVILNLINLGQLYAQEDLIINTYNRPSKSLNGQWNYIIDPYENGFYNYRYEAFDNFKSPGKGAYFMNSKPENKSDLVEYDFDTSDKIQVPGDWNSQKERLFYYEGTIWYKKSFDYTKTKMNNRIFVYFGAVNYQADLYLNGKKLGTHIGGFTPFNFEVTNHLKEKDNFLIIKVDNKRTKEAVPTLNTDWWNYGGITRDIILLETPANFIRDYFIHFDPEDKNQLKGFVKLSGNDIADKKVSLTIPEIGLNHELITNEQGFAPLRVKLEAITYWSVENPKLYEVIFKTEEDEINDQIGFRSIETNGPYILLNDRKIFFKGYLNSRRESDSWRPSPFFGRC
jgi:beta-glucuronidase